MKRVRRFLHRLLALIKGAGREDFTAELETHLELRPCAAFRSRRRGIVVACMAGDARSGDRGIEGRLRPTRTPVLTGVAPHLLTPRHGVEELSAERR